MIWPARVDPVFVTTDHETVLSIYLSIFGCVGSLLMHAQAFSSCCEQGLLFIAVPGLLIEGASLAVEHGL